MELNLQKPLLFFDIESTGLNIPTDCIAELSFVKIMPGGEERIKTWRFKPWDYALDMQHPMNPSASAVNGIKDEDLKDCPRFCDSIDEILEWIEGSDFAGFNSAKFDLPMLAEEFERAARYLGRELPVDLHGVKMVDVQNIFHLLEPRNLKAAYRFYCGGEDFENAHSAEADTVATYKVLKGQLDRYPDTLKNDVNFLANFSTTQTGRNNVDYAGRLVYNDKREPVINFGKHKGKTAREVYLTEPSYFAWIENGEFTLDTKRQFARIKHEIDTERKAQRDAKNNRPATDDELKSLKDKFNGTLFG
ncbi:MAG: 3'-5' exonuclease [Bacteroidales bacterium]|nr:3'-5' exonuclease [Bacteroidales bacterium]